MLCRMVLYIIVFYTGSPISVVPIFKVDTLDVIS